MGFLADTPNFFLHMGLFIKYAGIFIFGLTNFHGPKINLTYPPTWSVHVLALENFESNCISLGLASQKTNTKMGKNIPQTTNLLSSFCLLFVFPVSKRQIINLNLKTKVRMHFDQKLLYLSLRITNIRTKL